MSKRKNDWKKNKEDLNSLSDRINNWPQATVRILEILASKGKLFSGGLLVVLVILALRMEPEDLGFATKKLIELVERHYLWGYIAFGFLFLATGTLLYNQRKRFHQRIYEIVKQKTELQKRLEKYTKQTELIESSKNQ